MLIEEHYLFPDTAARLTDYLRQQTYPTENPQQFAQAIQEALTAMCQDSHLRFWYAPEEAATRAIPDVQSTAEEALEVAHRLAQNAE